MDNITVPTSPANGSMLPPNGFQPASAILKASSANSSTGTLRNASGGLPPIPKNRPAVEQTKEKAEEATSASVAKAKPINRPVASKNAIVYNAVQRRNPVLGAIKNVGIEIGDIVADYQVGTHNGVLFLSLKYHRLHPEYIHQRLEKMKNMYNLRILLILCDVNEHQQSLRELGKIAIINHLTTFIAWSNEEVAQYITTFKAYEHKGDETLKERIHQSYHEQLQHVLISGKKVNKTDADNLASQFGSFANITRQPSKVLSIVKGLAAVKVTSLIDAFNKPFLVGGLRRPEDTTGMGKEKGVEPTETRIDGPGAEELEPIGSPDWPDEPDEPPRSRGRGRTPSRSPGVSPEARGGGDGDGEGLPGAAAWRDPLEDGEDDGPPVAKRARVGG